MEPDRPESETPGRRTVSILSHDLSLNCAARAMLLADLLRPGYAVRVVGPRFGRSIWEPCAGVIPGENAPQGVPFPRFLHSMARLRSLVDGDVVIAQKPRFGSFGVALDLARRRGCPILLDVDDDEMRLFTDRRAGRLRDLASLRNPNGFAWTRRLASRIAEADAITAGSPSLARKYAGTFIPYAVDSAVVDPERFRADEERARLGLSDRFVVVFCGSPRPHKGLDVLARAIGRIEGVAAHLHVIAPMNEGGEKRDLLRMARGRISFQSPIPRAELPRHLAAAHAIVIPQRDTPFSRMQVPAKLFDAMAMGRPIIASRVGDIPEILDGCGILVNPEDDAAIAGALMTVASDPGRAASMGASVRELHSSRYDADVVSRRLTAVVESLAAGSRTAASVAR